MKRFRQIFGGRAGRRDLERDAGAVYQKLMDASRAPALFGDGAMEDDYEGRLDMLALHLAGLQSALRGRGEQGARLAQAVFDHMIADFDIALREEGLTDSGVKRRIKPMVAYIYSRIKDFELGLEAPRASDSPPNNSLYEALTDILNTRTKKSPQFVEKIAVYFENYVGALGEASLGEIAKGGVIIREFPPRQQNNRI